jgi:hypothetical protein
MMRFLIVIFISIFVSNSAFSQTNKFGDKKVEKWLKQADKYLPDFHRDSVISVYPIYEFSSKKKYRKIQFSKVPTSYSEIDSLMDYEHLVIDEILVKTTNGIWWLRGLDSTKKIYCGYRNSNALDKLFNYLGSVKVDKTYCGFTNWDYLVEKDGQRQLIKYRAGSWQECDLPDVFESDVNLVDINEGYFPRKRPKRMAPVIAH